MNAALTVLLTTLADGGLGPSGKQALQGLAALVPGIAADCSPTELAQAVAAHADWDPVTVQKLAAWRTSLTELFAADMSTASTVAAAMDARSPGSGSWYQGDHLDFGRGFFQGPVIGKQVVNNYAYDPSAHPSPPARQPQAQLPPATVGFAGRMEDLDCLLMALEPDPAANGDDDGRPARVRRTIAAVTGMAGVGKTAFAVQAAHLADDRNWFPGGTFFVDMDGYGANTLTSDRILPSLLRALGARPEDIPRDGDSHVGHYRTLLKSSERVLIVIDNVSSPAQVTPLLPGDPRHRVLITSRDKLPQLGAYRLSLKELTPGASLELLDHALRDTGPYEDTRMTDDPEAAARLVELCGHLPLALQIAAALLAIDREKPLGELVDELAESRTRIDMLDDGYRSVRAAFDLSYHRLPDDHARLLRLLSMAAEPEIGTDALVALLADGVPAATGLSRALAALERVYLAERGSGRQRWRLHDLVRAYAMNIVGGDPLLKDEAVVARQRLLTHYWQLADEADNDLRGLRPATAAQEQAALAWFDTERLVLSAAVQWGVEDRRHATTAVDLTLCTVEYLRLRGYTDDAIAMTETAVKAAQEAKDLLRESLAARCLADALLRAERFEEAAHVLGRARELLERRGDRTRAAQVLSELAITLSYLSLYEEAEEALRSALAVHVETEDRMEEARVLNNLGVISMRRGDLVAATDALARARAVFAELGDATNEGAAWTNLGVVLGYRGDSAGAAEAYGRHAEIAVGIDEWYSAGQAFRAQAEAWEGAGEPADARTSWRRAAESFDRADAREDAQDARTHILDDSRPAIGPVPL
ncbi:tetratricopeptide repeat protein [Streptomyces phaeofaciens]|uniref:tetratricopeptide repeat protein n=1 Tax=Streptomyces phaeofaciens TaxID=68254 RepID=UPI0036757A3A